MSLVKSFSVGNGDMFYIQHGTDNFSIIDCSLPGDREDEIVDDEIATAKEDKGITRFISTHPDQDHLQGLVRLDDRFELLNFYVVNNAATRPAVSVAPAVAGGVSAGAVSRPARKAMKPKILSATRSCGATRGRRSTSNVVVRAGG